MEDSITIRSVNENEYGEVAACFAETRGPHYYSADYYNAEFMTSRHELFAAFDSGGRMAGVIGVSGGLFNKERSTGCLLTVRPDYARRGIANALLGYIILLLRERGLRAVKGQTVTGHIAAQTIVERYGWIPTGFLYGARDKRNAVPEGDGKSALILYTGRLSVRDAGGLYVHGDCSGLARRIYAELNAEADFRSDGKCGKTILNSYADAHNSALYIQTLECGADVVAEINKLRERNEEMSVTIALNIGSPSAVYGYEALREAGYCFCGFEPVGQYEHVVLYSGEMPQDMKLTKAAEELKREVNQI